MILGCVSFGLAAILGFGGILPPAFVENRGQWDASIRLAAEFPGATLLALDRGFGLACAGGRVDFRLCGTSAESLAAGRDVLPGRVNWLIGADPARWATDARRFASARVEGGIPGVALVLRASGAEPEYDVELAAGAPQRVVFACAGARSLRVEGDEVIVETERFTIRQRAPRAFARGADGAKKPLRSRVVALGESSFALESDANGADACDSAVIDPALEVLTYFGGNREDEIESLAIGPQGDVYLAGTTESSTLPATPGTFDPSYTPQQSDGDAFVARFSSDLATLEWLTYLGGGSAESASAIAVDATGSALVAGTTRSSNFPTTPGAFDTTHGVNSEDAFVVKFNPAGNALLAATYFGGEWIDAATALAIDPAGRLVLCGRTISSALPVTTSALQPQKNGSFDAFVAVLDPLAKVLVYSTYLGGEGDDYATALTAAADGTISVAGETRSAAFPATAGAFDTTFGGVRDAFVAEIAPSGALAFASYLGAPTFFGQGGSDAAAALARDASGALTVAGGTDSPGFPITPGAFDPWPKLSYDAFVTRFAPGGSSLVYSTFLGGTWDDRATALALGKDGRAIVAGWTASPDFPQEGNGPSLAGAGPDAFVAALAASGSELLVTARYGGSAIDEAHALAIDASLAAVAAGVTSSGNLPTTPGAFDSTKDLATDAFLSRVTLCPGGFDLYGAGCAGSGGFTPSLAGGGCPTGGLAVELEIGSGLGGAIALVLLGQGAGPLPLVPSCALQIAPLLPVLSIPLALSGSGPGAGLATLSATIPAGSPPAHVYLQVVVADPGAAGGIAATNPIRMRIDG